MGGDVTVESAPGAGSTFTVTLDAAGGAGRLAARTTLRATAPGGAAGKPLAASGLRVLVVDDHPVNREVLVRQLELLGHRSRHAPMTASRRWKPGRAGRYAAVLADIHMPRMDGYELTRADPRRGGRARHGRARARRSSP